MPAHPTLCCLAGEQLCHDVGMHSPPRLAWAHGRLWPSDAPILTAFDAGATIGSGVFDTALVKDGVVVCADAHIARLMSSCAAANYASPSREEIDGAIAELLRAAPASTLQRARLRLTWYCAPAATSGTFTATLTEAPPSARSATLRLSRYRVDETSPLSAIKAIGYAPYAHALAEARAAGADEALLLNTAGNVCEGATSNIFAVLGDTLCTPPLNEGPLAGVTRATALRAASSAGLPICEQPISFSQLNDADGLLLSSSLRGLQAVTHMNGTPMRISPLARSFMHAFSEHSPTR